MFDVIAHYRVLEANKLPGFTPFERQTFQELLAEHGSVVLNDGETPLDLLWKVEFKDGEGPLTVAFKDPGDARRLSLAFEERTGRVLEYEISAPDVNEMEVRSCLVNRKIETVRRNFDPDSAERREELLSLLEGDERIKNGDLPLLLAESIISATREDSSGVCLQARRAQNLLSNRFGKEAILPLVETLKRTVRAEPKSLEQSLGIEETRAEYDALRESVGKKGILRSFVEAVRWSINFPTDDELALFDMEFYRFMSAVAEYGPNSYGSKAIRFEASELPRRIRRPLSKLMDEFEEREQSIELSGRS
ncbi:MAG: hypothetical protein KDD70_13560 [Bdellovibrionales bacterium]|nr:hypothetical protein [Bdellovibrionales bacterium]